MIVVRMPEALRAEPSAILALPLRVGEFGMVPLSRVARLRQTPAVEPILHDGGKRRAALMVNLATSDLAGYVAKAQAAVNDQVKLPPGYRIEFGGQFHQLEAANRRLELVVPAALLLIFGLVCAALGSVREAAIVYAGIPFAVTLDSTLEILCPQNGECEASNSTTSATGRLGQSFPGLEIDQQ